MSKPINFKVMYDEVPEPIRPDGAGATDLGPRDIIRDLENPNMLVPPITDAGTVPNLRFSFSDTNMVLKEGGWSRQITSRDLPIATTIAGVNMSLTPGGVRELHWHKQVEWSFVTVGKARITVVDQNGRNFIADVGVGDIWYFPPGLPHSIQGLEEGCEFILVFDEGDFSDLDTFSISDFFAHTPKEVLSANFGVPERAFEDIPKVQKYIFQAEVPGPLESVAIPDPFGTRNFTHNLLGQQPIISPGGSVRIVDSSNFPVSEKIAAALVEIVPGGMRELHWHPNNDEWQYVLSGTGRMTAFAADGVARTTDIRAGDVGYMPFCYGHYIQNTGKETLWYLEVFKSSHYADISLTQWMSLVPDQLVRDNLNVGSEVMDSLRKTKWPVVRF
ncbi:cupin domain-containing protein [Paenibacillus macquariensis]|uniref:Oxalate decarboxylase n=1 Tax=Paenibacillus macquariensis TaxID=948756 RepID=A0ABY1JND8_9BACL|nr:cupin domain-containing protein [Paenibacillus macquariensis]MEC0092190.1 cupin domain-containing protein [Paenibacillus macquariensis]OAB37261.1 oxalate decarboxylase [Paenibacillus macquariensis subsp. macquariensis]SIQ49367.1 oxalate decarboxylase [Paenibacillus macquariensis]